jgi:DNA-binding MarR family transcriptional regulator
MRIERPLHWCTEYLDIPGIRVNPGPIMATDAELTFVDKLGRFFARQYGLPPAFGRVSAWLLTCDPPEQTAAEIAEALQTSRSAVGSAIAALENQGQLQRTRAAGERADRVGFHPESAVRALESREEYGAVLALAREGLEVLRDAPPARRARLLGVVAFYEFLLERMPALAEEWRVRRDELRASGELPDPSQGES